MYFDRIYSKRNTYKFDLPRTIEERRSFFETMMDVNKRLIISMYRTEDFFLNINKPPKLEEWIMRYDRIMGFTPDSITLGEEMGLLITDGDVRVDLYYHLEKLVHLYNKKT